MPTCPICNEPIDAADLAANTHRADFVADLTARYGASVCRWCADEAVVTADGEVLMPCDAVWCDEMGDWFADDAAACEAICERRAWEADKAMMRRWQQ